MQSKPDARLLFDGQRHTQREELLGTWCVTSILPVRIFRAIVSRSLARELGACGPRQGCPIFRRLLFFFWGRGVGKISEGQRGCILIWGGDHLLASRSRGSIGTVSDAVLSSRKRSFSRCVFCRVRVRVVSSRATSGFRRWRVPRRMLLHGSTSEGKKEGDTDERMHASENNVPGGSQQC